MSKRVLASFRSEKSELVVTGEAWSLSCSASKDTHVTLSSAHWLRRLREKGNRGFAIALMLSAIFGIAAATPSSAIIGYVVDESDRPVAEASVTAVHVNAGLAWSSSVTSASPQIIAATRSDADGRFELLVPRAERSRVNCLLCNHGGKSGAIQSLSYGKSMRLILR